MNAWDRMIAVFSPQRALRNETARLAVDQVRSVRARQSKRWLDNTGVADFDVNTGRVEDAIPRAAVNRRRIRRLLATNPYASKVRQTLLNNLVGFGIVGTPKAPKKVIEAWKVWAKNADWQRRLDFYGLQDLAIGTMLGDGECFIVRRFDRSKDGVIATRIEVLDGDMLDPGSGQQAIEYDDFGRPMKYRFKASRNALSSRAGNPLEFAAADVIHLYRPDWPGQMRGRSIFEPVIKRFEDIDEYIEADVVRKKIESCFAAFITPSEESIGQEVPMGADSDETTINDLEVEFFEPGMIQRLQAGDQVTFGDPKPSTAIAEFSRVVLLGATTGAGVPYEHGTGDLSNVNYSSYRAGTLEFQRFCGRLQWLLIIPGMLERIWDWFLEDAFQTGVIAKRFYEIGWTPPAFESIDRLKDAKAIREELGMGVTSLRKEIGARGENFDELVEEIAQDKVKLEQLGLQLEGTNAPARGSPDKASANNEGDNGNASGD